jgi:hypothetical protein
LDEGSNLNADEIGGGKDSMAQHKSQTILFVQRSESQRLRHNRVTSVWLEIGFLQVLQSMLLGQRKTDTLVRILW